MSEHAHAVNAAVSGRSALPSTATPMAATRAMTRFLNREDLPFSALIEPARDATRTELARSDSPFALVVHDRSMFGFNTHTSKTDRLQRSHATDLGYELGSASVVDAADGRPLGVMELRLRTGAGMLGTRIGETAMPPGHVDELLEAMDESRNWQLDKAPIRAIDREADSVGHYRAWSAARHRFLVRADDDRVVLWNDAECSLAEVVRGSSLEFQDVLNRAGEPAVVAIAAGTGRVRVAETEVVPHRPAKQVVPGERSASGHEKKIDVPGPPIPLRPVVTRVVNGVGKVIAEWCLLTNVDKGIVSAAAIGRWYAWRWAIETYRKSSKSSGTNAEEWQQESGEAFLRRPCVATMACLTVWHLQRDESEEAAKLRKVLARLSGRRMTRGVESTAAALPAGLEKLSAIGDLPRSEGLAEVLALARKVLPRLFRSG